MLKQLHTSYPAYEDGTDRVFRNVGIQQSDAGEIPKRIHTTFRSQTKMHVYIKKKNCIDLGGQINPALKSSKRSTFKHFHRNIERHFKTFTLSVRKGKITKRTVA